MAGRPGLWLAGAMLSAALLESRAVAADQAAPAAAPDAQGETAILALTINGTGDEQPALFLRRPEGLWARAADLDSWRILRPDVAPLRVDGEDFLPLSRLPGLKAEIDEAAQSVKLFVPAELFAGQKVVANAPGVPKLSPSIPAGFVNYNIVGEAGSGFARASGLFDVGYSADGKLAETTFALGKGGVGRAARRLETFLLHDSPSNATRLVVGDTITASSGWSRPIRYGGVKFGTDFGLRPGFITFPTADFAGRTLLPSSVEFYANGALRYRSEVDRGPFAIDQAPLPVGAGLLTVVTKDVLGVERRSTMPYYVSANLLRAGLSRWSFEIGAERDDYALKSFDYSRPFVSGQYRYGLNNWLTVEGRSEIGSRVQDAGVSVAAAFARLGEFGATAAVSSGTGDGLLYGASYNRVSSNWDIGFSYQRTNRAFTQLGIREPLEKIRRQVQGNAGFTLGRAGRIGASYAEVLNGAGGRTQVGSLTYSTTVGRFGFLDMFAIRIVSRDSENNFNLGAGLSIPFGRRGNARIGAELQDGKPVATGDFRKAPPNDGGWGYGASARLGGFDQQRADATYRADYGEFRGEVARFDSDVGGRISADGALAFAHGQVFKTRRLDGAFGIVDAAGYPGVRVYQDNRPLTKTNAQGIAIVPQLRAYQENSIKLAPDDMPIGARVDADDIILIPSYRAGVLAKFAVRAGHPATVRLHLADGEPVPPGAAVSVDDGREQTFAGYEGAVFVNDVRETMVLRAEAPGMGRCTAKVSAPGAGKVDLPEIGPVTCVLEKAK